MNSDRIKEIQQTTSYPNNVSVKQALLQVWNECEREKPTPKDGLSELIEWVNNTYPNFNLEDFNQKAKQIQNGL